MNIKRILVTGANGQLGWELSQLAAGYPNFEFIVVDRSILDLSKPATFEAIINNYAPDCIINTAAYTAVDKAETEKELAFTVNATAVETMASIAGNLHIPFITYSTDYVFSGNASSPYLPTMVQSPVNYYGETKAIGEQLALAANKHTIIIRTSWVFSSHGNNFVKTMLRLMREKESLNVVGDQIGRPTYAKDLAKATIKMLELMNKGVALNGIYHYANAGETTWFGFAKKIKEITGLDCQLNSITTDQFLTPAKRPNYSVLDTHRIEIALGIQIPHWEYALQECIVELGK